MAINELVIIEYPRNEIVKLNDLYENRLRDIQTKTKELIKEIETLLNKTEQ